MKENCRSARKKGDNLRSIEKLRSEFDGKLYLFSNDQEIGERLLNDAEKEGYLFGKVKPSEKQWSDMIAVNKDKTISYVGIIGRIAYQTGEATGIDYKKYVSGEDDYMWEK